MSSGIKLDPRCKEIYDEMKLIKKGQTRKMAIFRISDDKKKVISDDACLEGKDISRDTSRDEEMFNLLREILEKSEHPLYVLYDFTFIADSGVRVEKLALITWCSDSFKTSPKMLFASTKDEVKKKFDVGDGLKFQVSEMDDLNYEEMKKKVQEGKK